MSEYRIYNDMDTGNIMDCLPEFEKIDFVYECFECLELYQRQDFIKVLGAEEVVGYLDEEIVEYLDDKAMIEELKGRGYKITQNGSEDN